MRLLMCVILSLLVCWGCGDPPNSVVEMVLPDKDMPAAEQPAVTEDEPAVTMADVKTTPVVIETEEPPVDAPPGTLEEEQPPPVVTEMPDLSLVAKMEAILASEGEVLSPIPDDIYELLWGNWKKAGSAEPRRFYTRYIDAEGIAIVGSDNVEKRTFQLARHIVLIMTSKLPGLREALAVTTPGVNNATEHFRLVLYTPDVENPGDMPEIQGGGEFLGGTFGYPLAITPLEAGVGYTNLLSKTLMHEMAHAIDHALTFYPHVLPDFRERLDIAWNRQQQHFRLREEEGLPVNSDFGEPYPVCHAQNTYNNVSVLEWWAVYVSNDWFDEMFEPGSLQRNPNFEHLEFERKLCGDIVNLADEIFPRYSVNQMVIDRYRD